jgi:hypothetical protein
MATELKSTGSGVVPYRLSVRQVLKMIDAGVFPDRANVELLGGLLVDKMTKNDPHNFAVGRVGDGLRRLDPADWFIREEKSIRLGRFWLPEPDIAVVRRPDDRYRAQTPRAGDIGLLVEVADATYAKDRGVKWRRYAASRIPVYWIINIPKRQIEVYTDPAGRGFGAHYGTAAAFGPDAEVPVVIDGAEVGRIAVRDILP